jgi:hypothetical protein
MTPKRILIALLMLMALDGALDATYAANDLPQPLGWSLSLGLSFSFLCFAWYRHDSDDRHFARSRWLNMGMVILTLFAMPYYLVRSRQRGQKLRAIGKCAGFAVLLVLASAVGMVLSGHAF